MDFGPEEGAVLVLLSCAVSRLDGATRLRDNWEGRLPELMRAAGFCTADELGRAFTPFGSASFFKAMLRHGD